jgi:hypothetical protein
MQAEDASATAGQEESRKAKEDGQSFHIARRRKVLFLPAARQLCSATKKNSADLSQRCTEADATLDLGEAKTKLGATGNSKSAKELRR